VGYAQSNARVSTLMRNLGASPYLENPELLEIRAVPGPTTGRINEFTMNISIKRAQADDSRGARGGPAKAGGGK
jgi:type IV pilus assembly protein PilN